MYRRHLFLAAAFLAASTGSYLFAQADSLSDAFAGLTRAERVTVQEHLQLGGFYSGALDGAYGPGTRQALVSAAAYIAENFPNPAPAPEVSPLSTHLADEIPLRILVVDDHSTNRKFCGAALRKLGFEPEMAESGQDAVEVARRTVLDAVLMDIEMPDMDGIEATERIRSLGPEFGRPYMVALTANAIAGDREKYLSARMDDYVSKPIEIGELIRALRAAADARRRPQRERIFGRGNGDGPDSRATETPS